MRRLRPVMMTMISTVFGGLPLILAFGAGAEARMALGWTIVGGLGFATVFDAVPDTGLPTICSPVSATHAMPTKTA